METTKTVLAPGERITVIDALRGFSLIGICLIHSMQHFGAMGTMTSQVEAGSFVGDRLFTRLDCPGGYFADICDTGVCFGVDV